MTRRVLENLYKELEKDGYTFFEQGCRFLDKRYDGKEDYVSYGILRSWDGGAFTPMRLSGILRIAKRKKTYLVQVRGEKEVQMVPAMPNQSLPMQENDMLVCFVQQGLLQTIADNREPVAECLRNSFWYCQEDKKALALNEAFGRLRGEFTLFESRAHEVHSTERNSVHFRRFVKREAAAFFEMDEMISSIESVAQRKRAEALRLAFITLHLIC